MGGRQTARNVLAAPSASVRLHATRRRRQVWPREKAARVYAGSPGPNIIFLAVMVRTGWGHGADTKK